MEEAATAPPAPAAAAAAAAAALGQRLGTLHLKTVVKEHSGRPVAQLAVPGGEWEGECGHLFATVAGPVATVYDGQHFGSYLAVVQQFVNGATEHTAGGDLLTCCWLPPASFPPGPPQPHGDAVLAVGCADGAVTLLSLARCAAVALLRPAPQPPAAAASSAAAATAAAAAPPPPAAAAVVDVAACAAQPGLLAAVDARGCVTLWDTRSAGGAAPAPLVTLPAGALCGGAGAACAAFAPDGGSLLLGAAAAAPPPPPAPRRAAAGGAGCTVWRLPLPGGDIGDAAFSAAAAAAAAACGPLPPPPPPAPPLPVCAVCSVVALPGGGVGAMWADGTAAGWPAPPAAAAWRLAPPPGGGGGGGGGGGDGPRPRLGASPCGSLLLLPGAPHAVLRCVAAAHGGAAAALALPPRRGAAWGGGGALTVGGACAGDGGWAVAAGRGGSVLRWETVAVAAPEGGGGGEGAAAAAAGDGDGDSDEG